MKRSKDLFVTAAILAAMTCGVSAHADTALTVSPIDASHVSASEKKLEMSEMTDAQIQAQINAMTPAEAAAYLNVTADEIERQSQNMADAGYDFSADEAGKDSKSAIALRDKARETDPRNGLLPFLHRQGLVMVWAVQNWAVATGTAVSNGAEAVAGAVGTAAHQLTRTDYGPGRSIHYIIRDTGRGIVAVVQGGVKLVDNAAVATYRFAKEAGMGFASDVEATYQGLTNTQHGPGRIVHYVVLDTGRAVKAVAGAVIKGAEVVGSAIVKGTEVVAQNVATGAKAEGQALAKDAVGLGHDAYYIVRDSARAVEAAYANVTNTQYGIARSFHYTVRDVGNAVGTSAEYVSSRVEAGASYEAGAFGKDVKGLGSDAHYIIRDTAHAVGTVLGKVFGGGDLPPAATLNTADCAQIDLQTRFENRIACSDDAPRMSAEDLQNLINGGSLE